MAFGTGEDAQNLHDQKIRRESSQKDYIVEKILDCVRKVKWAAHAYIIYGEICVLIPSCERSIRRAIGFHIGVLVWYRMICLAVWSRNKSPREIRSSREKVIQLLLGLSHVFFVGINVCCLTKSCATNCITAREFVLALVSWVHNCY